MLTPNQANRLRTAITRHASCQFRAGRLSVRTDPAVRARVYVAADDAQAALCALLTELTQEETKNETDLLECAA